MAAGGLSGEGVSRVDRRLPGFLSETRPGGLASGLEPKEKVLRDTRIGATLGPNFAWSEAPTRNNQARAAEDKSREVGQ